MTTPILFVHSSDELYGSDIVLLELVRRLDPQRYRPIVVTPTDIAYAGQLSAALEQTGIAHRAVDMPVLRRRYLSPRGLPSFLRRLRRGPRQLSDIMTSAGVRLVHSNTSAVWGGALASRRCDLPHLWHVHEIITQPRAVRRLTAFMIMRNSDHVVAISRAVADHLLADEPGLVSRLSVIYDAVDTARFHPDLDGARVRAQWGVDHADVLVGVVGRISAGKGQDFFLRAFARAQESAPALRAVIVGDVVPGEDWRRDELLALTQELGIADRVIWAGYRSDAPEVMAALDVLVSPSVHPEAFGMVVIEAMATGRPVIATAHGGPLETVADGESGFLVSPDSPLPLANALAALALAPDLRAQFGERARRRAVEQFGFDRYVAAFTALYDRLKM